jgi:hypothetical protein
MRRREAPDRPPERPRRPGRGRLRAGRDRGPRGPDREPRRGRPLLRALLDAANAYGSKPPGALQGGERTNGPNFNVRQVSADDALYAIRNGGFSGSIMPANIVVGEQADLVADFLEQYSGSESGTNDPTSSGESGP